jgi:hypothetical protein
MENNLFYARPYKDCGLGLFSVILKDDNILISHIEDELFNRGMIIASVNEANYAFVVSTGSEGRDAKISQQNEVRDCFYVSLTEAISTASEKSEGSAQS